MSDVPLERNAERLVRIYRKIREAREQATSEYNKKDAELKAQLDVVAKMLIDLMDEDKATGMTTTEGTVTKVIKNKYWNVDWPAFNQYVKEHDLFDLFEKRIAQKNMAEYLASNPEAAVPGLQMDRRYDVLVRKPSSRSKPE